MVSIRVRYGFRWHSDKSYRTSRMSAYCNTEKVSAVHSYISYGPIIWNSATKHKTKKIHRMQMYVLNARSNAPSTPIHKQLGIPKFNDIANIHSCVN